MHVGLGRLELLLRDVQLLNGFVRSIKQRPARGTHSEFRLRLMVVPRERAELRHLPLGLFAGIQDYWLLRLRERLRLREILLLLLSGVEVVQLWRLHVLLKVLLYFLLLPESHSPLLFRKVLRLLLNLYLVQHLLPN